MSTEPQRDHMEARDSPAQETPIDVLQRWQDLGAVWRVVSRSPTQVTVAMLSCDGGEEVQRLTSSDPDLGAWLADRTTSEE